VEIKQIVLTEKCNLDCKYCYMQQRNTMLTKDIFMKFYKTFDKDYQIDLFGGEPLLNWPMVKIITETCWKDSKCLGVNLYSNGLMLDQEKIDFIKQNNVNFFWSYDGLWAEEEISHDTLEMVKQLTNFAAVQIGSPNLNLVENLQYFYDIGMVPTFTLMRDKRWTLIDVIQFRGEFRSLCYEVIKNFRSRINFVPKIIYITVKRLIEGLNNKRSMSWCGAGERMQCYMPNGETYPCARFGTEDYRSEFDAYKDCEKCDLDFFCDKGCYHQAAKNAGILKEICELNRIVITCVTELNHMLKDNGDWRKMIVKIEEEALCTE